MSDFSELLRQGASNAWLFAPSAVALGALHGLEPGHSKTMMAAFIVAVRGTPLQAAVLGLGATVSHTAVVWAVALAGLHFGAGLNTGRSEPYFQIASAIAILAIALWMAWRTAWPRRGAEARDHAHAHDESRDFAAGGARLTLAIHETGAPPRWRLTSSGALPAPEAVALTTTRADGARQVFAFAARGLYLESLAEIPEPHAFAARLTLREGEREAAFDADFREPDHSHAQDEDDDAHARAHASDVARRFAGREVTTGQIALFGLTGGLIPCPASITILMLCLQLKQIALGAALVLCFSIGLALTLVGVGVVASLGARRASARWPGLAALAARAPYLSAALMLAVGLYTGALGWNALTAAP